MMCRDHHEEIHCERCDTCDYVFVFPPEEYQDIIAICRNCGDWWNP